MQRRLSFMVSEELFGAIESARGDVARERWLRRTVEQALGPTGGDLPALSTPPRGDDPAPAEQPEVRRAVRGAREAAARAGGLVGQLLEDAADAVVPPEADGLGPVRGVPRREFRPYPKGGKR